jgi:hypothetical protein
LCVLHGKQQHSLIVSRRSNIFTIRAKARVRYDPVILGLAAVVLTAGSLLAGFIPVRSVAAIATIQALRRSNPGHDQSARRVSNERSAWLMPVKTLDWSIANEGKPISQRRE